MSLGKSQTTQWCSKCKEAFTSCGSSGQIRTSESAAASCTSGKKRAQKLTLNEWSVFAADSPIKDLPLPQQAEAQVCNWLLAMTARLDMVGNSGRLYGRIVFDSLGDLLDFDIRRLDRTMLGHGFANWMNALSSGEILLDIINGMVEQLMSQCSNLENFTFMGKPWVPLPVKRMLHTAPNKMAICTFLLNHQCLFDFLEPIANGIHPLPKRLPVKPGKVEDIRDAVELVRRVGHTLLRNSYTTREWTWKALMLIVMTLMALTGSLGKGLEPLFTCLTGESNLKKLVVPQLHQAYMLTRDSHVFVPLSALEVSVIECSFPYKRVLKQGPIQFNSQMAVDFNLN